MSRRVTSVSSSRFSSAKTSSLRAVVVPSSSNRDFSSERISRSLVRLRSASVAATFSSPSTWCAPESVTNCFCRDASNVPCSTSRAAMLSFSFRSTPCFLTNCALSFDKSSRSRVTVVSVWLSTLRSFSTPDFSLSRRVTSVSSSPRTANNACCVCSSDSSSAWSAPSRPTNVALSRANRSRACSKEATLCTKPPICWSRSAVAACASSARRVTSPSCKRKPTTSSPSPAMFISNAVFSALSRSTRRSVLSSWSVKSTFRIRMTTNAIRNTMTITIITSVNEGHTLSSLVEAVAAPRRLTNPGTFIPGFFR